MKMALGVTASAMLFFAAPAAASTEQDCVAAKLGPRLGVIQQLSSHHLDLSRPRAVSHLFLGSDRRLREVAAQVVALGYTVQERSHGRLLAVATIPVNADWVRVTIPRMFKAAAVASIEYDGWDVDVASDHISDSSGQ